MQDALATAEPDDENSDAVTRAIVSAARRTRLEAESRFLDEAERLAAEAAPFDLSDERPRRGRPVRSAL